MNIGSFFKALVSVAQSDAKTILLPQVVTSAQAVAANQSPAVLAAQGAALLATSIKLGTQVEADELQTLADVVADLAGKAVASTTPATTPASAAAAAVAG